LSGDDGTTPEVQSGVLMKEAENVYALWCSGRMYCEGMLVTLKLLKRQDLVSTIARLVRPANDQIVGYIGNVLSLNNNEAFNILIPSYLVEMVFPFRMFCVKLFTGGMDFQNLGYQQDLKCACMSQV
jgi:hypothetical protein